MSYFDLDFANDITDRKSVTGFLVKHYGNNVFWQSKKQSIVTLSSTEVEYVVLSKSVWELKFLNQLINEILNQDLTPVIYHDNQNSIIIAKNLETKGS